MSAPVHRLKKAEIVALSKRYCKAHNHRYLEHWECYLRECKEEQEKIGFLDIEASNLAATYGYIISYCIKERGGPILEYVLSRKDIESGKPDLQLMRQCIEDMRKFDRLVVYYGGDHRFDIPFLRSRALFYGLNFPTNKEIKITDVYPWVRNKLKLHSNRLQVACEFLGIPAKDHPLKQDIWIRAQIGDPEALAYILEHNREDVISTEILYEKLLELCNVTNTSI